ncbi:hypothetical protein TSUD_403750 [Trifolium subterraneum]|uniref:FAS1 domain-containing protein n=1 Tax=Trifolium subterraneum TaxID=3900 RepID=A0A2Z6PD94_TRISU|nr:hypothetical protein TSUD_403750 [Trifolium subterraneum]
MLIASGVYDDLKLKQHHVLTLFAPVDKAFAHLPPSFALQLLPYDQKNLVLKAHILPIYYPLNLLLATTSPQQITLANTDFIGSGFTLNISSVKGRISLSTGVVKAVITRTVLDENPIIIFGISKVLIPNEIFGKKFHSPPPPPDVPSPPAVDGKDSDDVSTVMWILGLLSLDIVLAFLLYYSVRLVGRI